MLGKVPAAIVGLLGLATAKSVPLASMQPHIWKSGLEGGKEYGSSHCHHPRPSPGLYPLPTPIPTVFTFPCPSTDPCRAYLPQQTRVFNRYQHRPFYRNHKPFQTDLELSFTELSRLYFQVDTGDCAASLKTNYEQRHEATTSASIFLMPAKKNKVSSSQNTKHTLPHRRQP